MTEVTTPVALPLKFKRRKISAVRQWPKGCGRPISSSSSVAVAASMPPDRSTPTPDPLAIHCEHPPPTRVIGLDKDVDSRSLDLVNPGELSNNLPIEPPEREIGEAKEAVDGRISPRKRLPEEDQVHVEIPEPWKEVFDDRAIEGQRYSKVYPPPKRRRVSAVREFPLGCGRNVSRKIESEAGKIELDQGRKNNPEGGEMPALKPRRVLEAKVVDVDSEKNLVKKKVVGSREGILGAKNEQQTHHASPLDDSNVEDTLSDGHESNKPVRLSRDGIGAGERDHKKLVERKHVKAASNAKNEKRMLQTSALSVPNLETLSGGHESKPMRISQDSSGLVERDAEKLLKRKPVEGTSDARKDGFFLSEVDESFDFIEDRQIVQALMASQTCPWRQSRKSVGTEATSVTHKSVAKKKVGLIAEKSSSKVPTIHQKMNEMVVFEPVQRSPSPPKHFIMEAIDVEDSPPREETDRAIVVHLGKQQQQQRRGRGRGQGQRQQLEVSLTPLLPSSNSKGGEGDEAGYRYKVKRSLRMYQAVFRKLMQDAESKKKCIIRIDLEASNILKRSNEYVHRGKKIIGPVPGIEVGDEFHFRTELSLVGLHGPLQAGIDTEYLNGVKVATSIVASGGYPDDVDDSDVLVYSGSGGTPQNDKQGSDQKLERGNLAMKNSIEAQNPVRVIYGFKEKGIDPRNAKGKIISTFTYDGLYFVERYWQELGPHGFHVFKFQLRRQAGQPETGKKEAKKSKNSRTREGVVVKDISMGKDLMPIPVVNTIDSELPSHFKYTREILYPPSYVKTPPTGCDCTNGCSDSNKCACAVKNGGELPFNLSGAIVQAKRLVYECGPTCKCPPSCQNRVSQLGIRIPLEVFKTKSTGWGVRSLQSIASGSFICEYTGEMLHDKEAEQRSNDEYLFDIGHNYDDHSLWEGLPTLMPEFRTSPYAKTENNDGFTLDAVKYGNVGRFINHCCSPNLYAQNVLYDHDDEKMPHIMFFAADNIPPLQELTYHYNYTIDEVRDSQGNIKRKNCYCGASDCTGRLY